MFIINGRLTIYKLINEIVEEMKELAEQSFKLK